MSNVSPTSILAGPTTTNTLVLKRYIIFYIFLIWLSLLPIFTITFMLIKYIQFNLILAFLLIPLYIFLSDFIIIISSIFWAWLFIKIINVIHYPKEGVFPRSSKNRDFRFWSLRAVIKKYPLWVCHHNPIPWADTIAYKLFGNRVNFTSPVLDGWIDAEFLEIGSGSIIGQGSVIMTSMITNEFLILRRVTIGKNCLVGAHAVVSPGTIMGDRVILGALSLTSVGQKLETGWVYIGTPAQKYRESHFKEDDFLTSEERAREKEYREEVGIIKEEGVISGRKSVKVIYQKYKTGYKTHRASKHKDKAKILRDKAEQLAKKREFKAERHERRAQTQKEQAKRAYQLAQINIEKKLQKKREKNTRKKKNENNEESQLK
ncbi:MAG: DapH/DapD/GlmU-related protein [Promethearchaeota archaeon]